MTEAARLVCWARERQGITVAQLGVRSGLPAALIADIEAGRADVDDADLERLLLVSGVALHRAPSGELTATPLALDVNAEDLAHARSLTMAQRLQSALGWNSFADRVFQAGQRARQ